MAWYARRLAEVVTLLTALTAVTTSPRLTPERSEPGGQDVFPRHCLRLWSRESRGALRASLLSPVRVQHKGGRFGERRFQDGALLLCCLFERDLGRFEGVQPIQQGLVILRGGRHGVGAKQSV